MCHITTSILPLASQVIQTLTCYIVSPQILIALKNKKGIDPDSYAWGTGELLYVVSFAFLGLAPQYVL